jgi:nucleoid DNA-binding protein
MNTFTTSELAGAISVNMNLTATEVEDCLAVASAAVQKSLQEGNAVDLLSLGVLSIKGGKVVFTASEKLENQAKNPNIEIKIEHSKGQLATDLWNSGASVYKHHVNSCN